MVSYLYSAHPWLRDESRALPLDILIFKLVKAYLHATPLRRAALKVTHLFCLVRFEALIDMFR